MLIAITVTPTAEAGVEVTFGAFYDNLAPYGEWIAMEGGTYAWRPLHVEEGWRPYWNGHWIWTDDGWYWDSDEPWSWATYHYGRWYCDDYYGWIWVPGYDWAPSWVEWRYGGDYVGWAPLGPYAIFNPDFGVHYVRRWVTPYHYWSFVDCRYVTSRDVRQYIYRSENNTRFIGRTRTAGSVRFDGGRVVTRGPEASYVERRGNIRLDRAQLVDVNGREEARVGRTGDRQSIGVYRPRIEERSGDLRNERPRDVKERERMPSLDTRSLDLRQRERAGETGRQIERMDPGRLPRTEERVGRMDNTGVREERENARVRSKDSERQGLGERTRRLDRRQDRLDNNAQGKDSGRHSVPRVDRPATRNVPDSRFSRPERGSGHRSAPSGKSGGGRRGDR
jgi:hypothetical protein